MTSISRYDKGFWPTTLLTIAILFLMLGQVSAAFVENLFHNKPITFAIFIFHKCDVLCSLFGAFIMLSVCTHHLLKIFRKTKNEETSDTKTNERTYDVFVVMYIALIFGTSIYIITVGALNRNILDVDATLLVLTSLPFGCCLLLLSVLLMRIVKFKMTEAVVSFHM
jgi:Ca2+/Na+ antiporter